MDIQMLTIRRFGIRSLAVRSLVVAAALAGVVALGVMTAQHASAAGVNGSPSDPAAAEQTVPEPADPVTPGEGDGTLPGEGAAGTLPEGESAVADGGSATPWVAVGVGVLLALALAGAVWASRKPTVMDLEETGTVADPTMSERRYIPPGF